MSIEQLQQKIKTLLEEQQSILDRCDNEGRDLTDAEQRKFDTLDAQYHKAKVDIQEMKMNNGHLVGPILPDISGQAEYRSGRGALRHPHQDSEALRDAFSRYLVSGEKSLSSDEYRAFVENRALQVDLDVQGGFLVPEAFQNEVIKILDDLIFMRKLCKQYFVRIGESVGYPTIDADPENPVWTSELATGVEDDEMAFGKRSFHPHPMALRILISKRLLRVSSVNVESEVRDRLGYKSATVEENAFLNGDGVNSPLGIFTLSEDHGIGAGRDFTTALTAQIKADDIINAVGELKSPYRRNAVWVASRSFETRIRTLKTGDGNYLLTQNMLAGGAKSLLMGFPMYISEFCPSTWSSGEYVACLFDPARYWIVDQLSLQIQVLTELYATQNCNGYILRKETDASPVDPNGFVRIKLK